MFQFLSRNSHLSVLFLRIATSMVFVYRGYGKLFGAGPAKTAQYFDSIGIPFASAAAYVSGSIEFFGGLMVGLGLLTRQASLLLLVNVLVAVFIAHRGQPYAAKEHAVQMAMLAVGTLFSGSGRWSLESLVRKHGD